MSTLRRHRRANLQTKPLEKIVDFQWLFKAYHVWFAASVSTSTASPSLTEISYLTTHPWWSAQCLFHQQIRTVWKFGISPKLQISLIRLSTTDFLLRNLLNFQQPLIPGFLGGPPAFHIWQEKRCSLALAGRDVMKAMGCWSLICAKNCDVQWLDTWDVLPDQKMLTDLFTLNWLDFRNPSIRKSVSVDRKFPGINQWSIIDSHEWFGWWCRHHGPQVDPTFFFGWHNYRQTPINEGSSRKATPNCTTRQLDCDPQTSKIEITIETNSRNSCNSFGSFLKNLCKIRRFLKLGDPKKSMGVHIERSFMTWILEWFKWAIPIPEPPGGSHRDGLLRRLCSSSYDVLNQREHYRSSTKESPKCGGRLRDDFHGGTSSWSFPWDFGVPLETSSIYRWDLSWSKPAIGYLDFSRTPHFEILWNDSPGGQSSQAAKTTSCFSGFFKHQDPAPKLHPWLQCISREN